MGKYEIEPAFDMLLEELERVIPELNAQISELTAQKKFDQAQIVLDKAKQVTAIQQKVKALREEWQALKAKTIELKKTEFADRLHEVEEMLKHDYAKVEQKILAHNSNLKTAFRSIGQSPKAA